ncbi:helix-turn-helix domain-containing protein [Roseibium sp.]|uniref:helix-turn-helix domain-containing protein n=1 Tax=Roseibium sp. TaxID=1936156 RepID=UPI003B515D13
MPGSEQIQRAVLHTTDIEELQDASSEWDQQYSQMAPGQFEGALELTQVGTRHIFREIWGKKIRYQGTAPEGSFGFALRFNQGADGNWVGRTAEANSVIFQAPGQEADFVSPNHWDALVLSISEEEVFSTVMALTGGEDLRNAFYGVLALKPDTAQKLRLRGLEFLKQSRRYSTTDPDHIAKSSEQLVRLFLWELVQALETRALVIEPGKSSRIVRQATEMISNDLSGTIGLLEICAELKVSLRTLHYAFQDVTDMSPATWLRRIRLNRVHRTLKNASADEIMVKQVALENGFIHAGHFSRQYHRLFGCLPSETLERH